MHKKRTIHPRIRKALARQIEAIQRARVRLQQGDDAEALHDFRVALRRTRSLLRPLLDIESKAQRLKRAGRPLWQYARQTNPLRDGEVQATLIATLPPELWGAAQQAWQADRQQRLDQQRHELIEALCRPRLLKQLDQLRRAGKRVLGELGRRELMDAGRLDLHILRRRLLRMLADGAEHPEHWHAIRLDAKRLRYLLEGFGYLEGTDWASELAACKAAQDSLGELHDVDVLIVDLNAAGLLNPALDEALGAERQNRLALAKVDLQTLAAILRHDPAPPA
ncbi:CHAD domain-containing protein [Parachitinimonas caeni]|uniref:CHAD domain-containing protein n=1 Tax=Parachitinimonas caeni TaxID=3031301 RepID=A0ABT7DYX9_9NEIS|nr:CHAD domain-containing protein [Parachitinimonas caeni]MDK2125219.1 CHAD domain-containing protein [Parachitinimonas caeni]